jgi:hypothetical protein
LKTFSDNEIKYLLLKYDSSLFCRMWNDSSPTLFGPWPMPSSTAWPCHTSMQTPTSTTLITGASFRLWQGKPFLYVSPSAEHYLELLLSDPHPTPVGCWVGANKYMLLFICNMVLIPKLLLTKHFDCWLLIIKTLIIFVHNEYNSYKKICAEINYLKAKVGGCGCLWLNTLE